MKTIHVGSSVAFILTLLALLAGYVWRSFYATAPYEMFATTVGAVFGGYIAKRAITKKAAYNPPCNGTNGDTE